MSDAEQIWLIAGGEPGAGRFGHLVQSLRKEQHLSVEEVAAQADLSVGTIRAIEQGRRAPSEQSGVRLLRLLLSEGEVAETNLAEHQTGVRPAYSFTDPQSGSRVRLVFRAKIAGDNRRWSSDRPRAGESKAEALVSELMSDPARLAEWATNIAPAFAQLGSAIGDLQVRAVQPAGHAEFGAIVRRLALIPALRIWRLEDLCELWERVDSGEASEYERDLDAKLNQLLSRYTPITESEDPLPPDGQPDS